MMSGLALLLLFLTSPVIRGTPYHYSIFQGGAHSGAETRQRSKNWCARVVHKNVSCAVVGGSESSLHPEILPCPLEVPNCVQQVIYRTHFRPTYKIGYKTVTELDWRCCPGYEGIDCREVKDGRLHQVERLPQTPPPSGQFPIPQVFHDPQTQSHENHPWGAEGQFRGHTGPRTLEDLGGSQSAPQHLEEEVQRLSQMVLDMQARMTDMSSNLRVDFQEDASKMLIALLNNHQQAPSAQAAEAQSVQVQSFSLDPGAASMDEVMNKINQVTDELESKSNVLDELLGRVSHHDGQIRLLMEATQTPLSSPPLVASPGDPDLRAYLDDKIRALREELMEGMEIKMADLKNSCDYKIMSVRDECEGQEANYLSLAELMDSKETDLRSEIQDLKTKLMEPGPEGTRVPAYILARVENLENRLNSSKEMVVARCRSIEEKLRREQAQAVTDLKESLEDRLSATEDRLTTLLVDPSTVITPPGGNPVRADTSGQDVNSLRSSVRSLEVRFNVLDQMCSKECKTNSTVVEKLPPDFQSVRTAVDAIGAKLRGHNSDAGATDGKLNHSCSSESVHQGMSSLKDRVSRLEDVIQNQSQSSTRGHSETGAGGDVEDLVELHRAQHEELRRQLAQLSSEVRTDVDRCSEKTQGVGENMTHLQSRMDSVETVCSKLDPISGSLQRIKEGLNKHVTALWTCVNHLNGTMRAHDRDIGGLRGTSETLQNTIAGVARDLEALTNNSPGKEGVPVRAGDAGPPRGSSQSLGVPLGPEDPGLPEAAVMETGEAGPPGKMTSFKLPRGTDGSMMPVQGFAGAPASPHKSSDPLKISMPVVVDMSMPHRPPSQNPAATSGDKVSFSAGLTLLPFEGEVGIIRFNKVLINDGGHYDPYTGIFTAPTDGRYLVTAVLAAQRGEHLEAVLSVSNRSVQKLNSAGFLSGGAAPPSHQQCGCGGATSLSLVLAMKRGDRMGVVMTAGKLAISAAPEVLSSFSAVLLYPSPSKR